MKLSSEQFERVRRLALNLAGIELVERHRELIDRRMGRQSAKHASDLEALLCAAESGEAKAIEQLLGLITTKFTGFFRHPAHFEAAAEHALRAALSTGRARLWCAGAATGEEPYSLAMAVIEKFCQDAPPVTILATDVDSAALAAAERGQYTCASLETMDPARRRRFFRDGDSPHSYCIAEAVRKLVELKPLNLTAGAWPTAEGPFDVIFCRNVLMYLSESHRRAITERISSLLPPGGLLILDPTEHLGEAAHLFGSDSSGMYVRKSCKLPGAYSDPSRKQP